MIWILVCTLVLNKQRTSCLLNPDFGLSRTLEVSDLVLVGILILIWIWSLVLDTPVFKVWLSKSWFWTLKDAWGSWFGFLMMIMIHERSLCSDKHILKFSFASVKFQLRYLFSSANKMCCLPGCLAGSVWLGSAKIKDQPSANQFLRIFSFYLLILVSWSVGLSVKS